MMGRAGQMGIDIGSGGGGTPRRTERGQRASPTPPPTPGESLELHQKKKDNVIRRRLWGSADNSACDATRVRASVSDQSEPPGVSSSDGAPHPPSAPPGRPLNLIIGSLCSRTSPRVRLISRIQNHRRQCGCSYPQWPRAFYLYDTRKTVNTKIYYCANDIILSAHLRRVRRIPIVVRIITTPRYSFKGPRRGRLLSARFPTAALQVTSARFRRDGSRNVDFRIVCPVRKTVVQCPSLSYNNNCNNIIPTVVVSSTHNKPIYI